MVVTGCSIVVAKCSESVLQHYKSLNVYRATKFCKQEGGTPLMYAAYNGYPQVVKLLLGR